MTDPDLLWVWEGIAVFTGAWAIALLRSSYRPCPPISKAEQRASKLLKEWLTQEQCIEYERRGYFEVKGSVTGTRYRIRSAPQMNVEQLDEHGRRVATLCFLPIGCLPVSDLMLAQKITLENDEGTALSVAHRRYS